MRPIMTFQFTTQLPRKEPMKGELTKAENFRIDYTTLKKLQNEFETALRQAESIHCLRIRKYIWSSCRDSIVDVYWPCHIVHRRTTQYSRFPWYWVSGYQTSHRFVFVHFHFIWIWMKEMQFIQNIHIIVINVVKIWLIKILRRLHSFTSSS